MNIAMRLYQRKRKGVSEGFYVEFENGTRKSLKTKDKKLAKRLFKQLEKEYLQSKVAQLTGKCTTRINTYHDEFIKWSKEMETRSTHRANKLALSKLMKQTGENLYIDQVSIKHLDMMIVEQKQNGLKLRSINNYIRHARASLNKAVEWGYVQQNPLRNAKELKVNQTVPKFIEKNHISKFISKTSDVDVRRFITASIATGRRRKELFNLLWENIDLKKRKYVVIAKGGKRQMYTINNVFLSVLKAIGIQKTGKVFTRFKNIDTWSKAIKKELIASGYPNHTLHSLRHTFASLKAAEGRTLREIQGLLGHSEQRTTEIYAHLTEDHLADISEVNLGPIDLNGGSTK